MNRSPKITTTITQRWRVGLAAAIFSLPSFSLSAIETVPFFEFSAKLKARPNLCMTERRDRSCFMDVELHWRTNQENDVCIYSDIDTETVACWSSELEGDKTISIHSDKDIHYRLVLNKTNLTVANTTISIQSVDPKVKKNRRRRHAWSLF